MKSPVAMTIVIALCSLLCPFDAGAVDAPHYDPAAGYTCATCHTVQLTRGSSSFDIICLNCHRPGDPSAGSNPITLSDAANPFGLYSAIGLTKMYQTSHRWDGSDTSPTAGAQPPVQWQMTTNGLRSRTEGKLSCIRCHNPHFNANGRFLRMPNDQDQLCLDCHRSRNVQSHIRGSHPVGIPYSDTKAGFKPITPNSVNPTAALGNYLKNGNVTCMTCHAVHFADTRSSTIDGRANFANLSSGDGHILRTDRRGAAVAASQPDNMNICTNCHAGKTSHNMKGQDIQCTDCHGAHVEYDPNDPAGANGINIFLVKRAVPKGANGSGQVFFRFTGSRREYKTDQGTGVCQGCHMVPAPGGLYPPEHAGSDPKVCSTCHFHNSSNGSFSGACTACHGYPPTTSTVGGSTGLAAPATGATQVNPGAHETHAKNRWMACNTCHNVYTVRPMPSGTIDIGFSINGSNFPGFVGSANSGTFNGTNLKLGYSWSASAGTSLTTGNPTITCIVYCHGSTLTGGSIAAPTWTITDGSQKMCGTCHGVTAVTAPASGSHQRHAGGGANGLAIPCASCHGLRNNNDHVNGSVEWDFGGLTGGGLYKGATVGSSGTIAPSASYGQCANFYCHSNGTSLQTTLSIPRTIPTWGGAVTGCDGCHDGLSTGPSYPNGAPKANSHAVHVVAFGYGCNTCHYDTTTSGTTISNPGNHANRIFNLRPNAAAGVNFTPTVGTPATPSSCATISCHGGNNATWGAKARCQDCHLVTTADIDDFSGTFWNNGVVSKINTTAWTMTGHGRVAAFPSGNPAADFSVTNACEYCHDYATPHKTASNPFRLKNFTDTPWGKNSVCMNCHATGSPGITVDGQLRNGSKKVDSYHFGNQHSSILNSGQFCWDCHDGHGDGNLYMIHDSVSATSDLNTGAPQGAGRSVLFTAAVTGTDYARSAPPFDGICNVCHTTTAHYTSGTGDGHNSTTRCTSCHSHNGQDAISAFAPGAGACNSCHGYPPARPGFVGTYNNWSTANAENYPGGGGAHTIDNHVSKLAKPGNGFAHCSKCHDSTDHKMTPIAFNPSQNIKVRVNLRYRLEAGKQYKYTSNRRDAGAHQTGTCSNNSCHYGATPKWDPAH
jgi:predicted CxxxxCH...CXXCH cytochrome family protein